MVDPELKNYSFTTNFDTYYIYDVKAKSYAEAEAVFLDRLNHIHSENVQVSDPISEYRDWEVLENPDKVGAE